MFYMLLHFVATLITAYREATMQVPHQVVAFSNKACNVARISVSRVVPVKLNKRDA